MNDEGVKMRSLINASMVGDSVRVVKIIVFRCSKVASCIFQS